MSETEKAAEQLDMIRIYRTGRSDEVNYNMLPAAIRRFHGESMDAAECREIKEAIEEQDEAKGVTTRRDPLKEDRWRAFGLTNSSTVTVAYEIEWSSGEEVGKLTELIAPYAIKKRLMLASTTDDRRFSPNFVLLAGEVVEVQRNSFFDAVLRHKAKKQGTDLWVIYPENLSEAASAGNTGEADRKAAKEAAKAAKSAIPENKAADEVEEAAKAAEDAIPENKAADKVEEAAKAAEDAIPENKAADKVGEAAKAAESARLEKEATDEIGRVAEESRRVIKAAEDTEAKRQADLKRKNQDIQSIKPKKKRKGPAESLKDDLTPRDSDIPAKRTSRKANVDYKPSG